MSNPRVLIIGCGIAGPVIALLLQKRGYEPVVLEKVRELGDAGASLMMFPNGFKVLAKIGLAGFVSDSAPHLKRFHDRAADGTDLGVSEIPCSFVGSYGFPGCGVKRTGLNLRLKEGLARAGIPVFEGWKLKEVREDRDGVVAVSEDGREIEGSFVVGCDGIKAVSRSLVLIEHGVREERAEYTGLTQTAGISPTPQSLGDDSTMMNIYGPSAHFICCPVSSSNISWAITQRDSVEASETWNLASASELLQQKNDLVAQFKDWCDPVPDLVRGAERIIKYGLYDRPQLEPRQWFSPNGRVILIGDAAHPTSPHLGQGANQALEDCYHLDKLLPDFDRSTALTSERLSEIFSTFANLRQPRTAALVKGARAQGESRVEDGGIEACKRRDERIKMAWRDEKAVEMRYDGLFREPY